LNLPYEPKFNDVNSFFKIILSKNLSQRICNFNLLRSHPLLHAFDFDRLLDFVIKPPHIPESFIDQNSNAGISLLSNYNMQFTYYLDNNNSYYLENNHNDVDDSYMFDEMFQKEHQWVGEF
jgi:hypothetical protein